MFDGNFWKEIKEKYPKGYMKFYKYRKEFFDNDKTHGNEDLGKLTKPFFESIINSYCYCDLETFFDENGIIILIIYCDYDEAKNYQRFSFDIINKQTNNLLSDKNIYYDTRPEAQLEAVKKAFEILNQQLENEE
jgi:hypothetical protein